ncbi:hypothetical protein Sm713_16020 [Streptomyces sp. TS71-3]|nr:hypothetical protein Sm713_16020 [Streptomyces sp. TS71-3]
MPSPSESTLDSTLTYSLTASWWEKTGWVPSPVTLTEGFSATACAVGIPAATNAALIVIEARNLRRDVRMCYLLPS